MTVSVYWVDPAVQGQSPLPTAGTGGPYTEGTNVTLPNGQKVNSVAHNPSLNLYTAIEDNTPWPTPPSYYVLQTDLYYQGNADPALIRVREERNPQQIDIEELRAMRLEQLRVLADDVDAQGYRVTLSAGSIAIPTEQRSRNWYVTAHGSTVPGSTTFRRADIFNVWYPHTKADCQACLDGLGVFHDAVIFANFETHEQVILAETDWQTLADYDITAGWPPAPVQGAAAQTDEWRAQALMEVLWSPSSPAPEIRDNGDPGRVWKFLLRDGNFGRTAADLRVRWAAGNGR